MGLFCIEIGPRSDTPTPAERHALELLLEAGASGIQAIRIHSRYLIEGELSPDNVATAQKLLTDPVTETSQVLGPGPARPSPGDQLEFEISPRPGVMDPAAESTLAELREEGLRIRSVRTSRRYVIPHPVALAPVMHAVRQVLANDCIESIVVGTAGVQPAPEPPVFHFELRRVAFRNLSDAELQRLSREGHLFLSLDEMRAVQSQFRSLGREPTDLELETIAQTWSEHCVHKTLKSAVVYHGDPIPGTTGPNPVEIRYLSLLKDTIVRATERLMSEGRGPECLSVFKDNAGIIALNEEFAVAFKVETHNHPSAIEPYGGAATGVGGCIRDVIGCGLGARPIAGTDVFCVAPACWPQDRVPRGVLQPRRVLRGIVRGVADYGNRMGIPTVNGAVVFDPRYLANPLVFCGSVGLIPRNRIEKAARDGDAIVLIGGRTGRDGIHGATFSSAELSDSHADEFSHAVQIGNAITQKRLLDGILRARDFSENAKTSPHCLYSAITDCGAGGLSSAVGEMAESIGAQVELDAVPLKYAGLRYDEIWISEAQERMVVAVPPDHLPRFLSIMREEETEATVIGHFGERDTAGQPVLRVRYNGNVVGELDMHFLHGGLPKRERRATWSRTSSASPPTFAPDENAASGDLLSHLRSHLARPGVASKEWIIRSYDHEVQGGSVVKPLSGAGAGPGDAAVLRPLLNSSRGIAIACGIAPHLSDVDPYWMAAAAIDEALRNVICVGADPHQTAILDNFCWGGCDDPEQLGALVRACQAAHDFALAYGLPFISGKDSLNNQFSPDSTDIDALIEALREYAGHDDADGKRLRTVLPQIEDRIRRTGRLAIPGTLLISAIAIVPDVRRCLTSDLKSPGNGLVLVPGLSPIGFDPISALTAHHAVADAVKDGFVRSCHDVSDGGWLTAAAEMAIGGTRGALIMTGDSGAAPFAERVAAYVLESPDPDALLSRLLERRVAAKRIGVVSDHSLLTVDGNSAHVSDLSRTWRT